MTEDTQELKAPNGATFQATDDGFVLEATTRSRASLFFVPMILVWLALPFIGNIEGFARVMIVVLGLVGFAGAAMSVAGHVVVRRAGKQIEVLTGVGPLGRRQKENWSQLRSVRERITERRNRKPREIAIVLDGPQRIAFGQMLNDERRTFLLRVLERELAKGS